MFVQGQTVEVTETGEGVTRKILGTGGTLMMTEVTFKKDAVGAMHSHPHEQVSYIVHGSFAFTLGSETQILRQGDSVYIPSNVEHGVVALEDRSIILDVFTPQREDFLY